MKIGLIDVDTHNFPNYALMKISAYHKVQGFNVEWAKGGLFAEEYDTIYKSKIFSFTPDIEDSEFTAKEIIKGGTGYDVRSRLSEEIENHKELDYTIYPQHPFSIQFLSRGCIRKCSFCVVKDKEGGIRPVEPLNLNPKGEWIEVLDNNFFGNPEWRSSVDYLLSTNQKVNLHGVDVRIMTEEQAYYLNQLKHKQAIKIAWDNPKQNLLPRIKDMLKYIKPYKIMCYVLIGYNSTIEEDLYRIESLRGLGISPFIMPFREYGSKEKASQYCRDLARYVNNKFLFKSCKFEDFEPRKGFKCKDYLTNKELL